MHFLIKEAKIAIPLINISLLENKNVIYDQDYRKHGLGSQFLQLCEQWLKKQGIKSLHDEARLNVVSFYRRNGYTEMPFEDPSGEPPSPHDIAMGKSL